MDYIKLAIGLVVGIAAVIASNKNVRLTIQSAIFPIAEILKDHTEKLNRLEFDYEISNGNRIFVRKMIKIIEQTVDVLHDKDNEFKISERHEASDFINYYGDMFISLSQTVLLKGIDNIGTDYFKLYASQKLGPCKDKMTDLFGADFTCKYMDNLGDGYTPYLDSVCAISEDWINSHDERYKNITLVFLQENVNRFVRFYFNNENRAIRRLKL